MGGNPIPGHFPKCLQQLQPIFHTLRAWADPGLKDYSEFQRLPRAGDFPEQ